MRLSVRGVAMRVKQCPRAAFALMAANRRAGNARIQPAIESDRGRSPDGERVLISTHRSRARAQQGDDYGSHLADGFLARGDEVFVLDNGSVAKTRHLIGKPGFHYVRDSVFNVEILEGLISRCDLITSVRLNFSPGNVLNSLRIT
jgi:hypothetical protein